MARLKPRHPEAGHGYPVKHLLDHEIEFSGICKYHEKGCHEGFVKPESFCARAELHETPQSEDFKKALHAWHNEPIRLKAEGLKGRKLGNALIQQVLSPGTMDMALPRKLGIDIVARYSSQLNYQLFIGPASAGEPMDVHTNAR